jgi:hypothetical protein
LEASKGALSLRVLRLRVLRKALRGLGLVGEAVSRFEGGGGILSLWVGLGCGGVCQ